MGFDVVGINVRTLDEHLDGVVVVSRLGHSPTAIEKHSPWPSGGTTRQSPQNSEDFSCMRLPGMLP